MICPKCNCKIEREDSNSFSCDECKMLWPKGKGWEVYSYTEMCEKDQKIKELEARNKQLEHWFHGYKTPEESMYNLVQKLSKAEDTLHFIDGEIRTTSPTMDGEPNYRISLDGAKRCKKKLKDYFNNKTEG